MKIFVETERLILREVMPEDVEGFFALDSDPEVVKYFKNQLMTEKGQAEKLINYVRKQYVDNGIGRWAIIEKGTNEFVGWTGLKYVTDSVNNRTNFYDIGYRLLRKHWGKGYATETAVASLEYGFNQMNIDEIFSGVHVDNAASNRIITKIGMNCIGSFVYFDSPHFWYSLKKEDWLKKKQKSLNKSNYRIVKMKDNFSDKSELYKQYRPEYPVELVDFICSKVNSFDKAWDCATGSGQMATALSNRFKTVEATDISNQQLANAIQLPNINYSNQPAEATNFQDAAFDLITVAQAIHWFDFDRFYSEARRTLKPEGLIAIIGYGQPSVNNEVDDVIFHFYETILGKYWDPERKFIDDNYETVPFPFDKIECPQFSINCNTTAERFLGYLGTWSAIKHYMKSNANNPIDLIRDDLIKAWGGESERIVKWPVLTLIGYSI